MNVLFLGNSFTYFFDMPGIFCEMTGASATMLARGGAYLREFLSASDPLGDAAAAVLAGRIPQVEVPVILKRFGPETGAKWDYIVVQEQSFNAVGNRQEYQKCAAELCEKIRASGAKPVIYATWAYKRGGKKLADTGLAFELMRTEMYKSYHQAAEASGAICADVGEIFAQIGDAAYDATDDYHPSLTGSQAAARAIARAIEEDMK